MNRNTYRYNSYKFKLLTIFLCFIVIAFMLYGPNLIQNRIEYKDKNEKPVEQEWKGVITIWDFAKPYQGGGSGFRWIKGKIKEFEKIYPGVLVELHCLGQKNGDIQLDLAIQSGRYPDIGPVGGNFGCVDKGLLEPMDDFFTPEKKERYMNYALNAVAYKGKLWGVPLYGTAPILLLNLEIFEKKSVEPPRDGQWTYGEFVDILKKLTYDGDNDGDIDIYGFNSYVMNGSYNLWGIILSDGWEVYDFTFGRYSVYTPEAVSGLKKLVDLSFKHRVVPEDFGTQSSSQGWKTFAFDEKVAVYPAGLWAVSQLETLKNEGKGFEFGIAEYPVGAMGKPVTAGSGVVSYGIFKQEDVKKREICMEFLDFIVNDFDGQEAVKRGVLPVRDTLYGQQNFDVNPEHIKTIPRMDKWNYVEDIINSHIRQTLIGKEDPEEALKLAQQEVDILFGNK